MASCCCRAQNHKAVVACHDSFSKLHNLQYKNSRYDSAVYFALAGLRCAEHSSVNAQVALSWLQVGKSYASLNLYDSAFYFLNKAQQFANETKDDRLSVECSNAFAVLYNFLSNNEEAIRCLLKSIDVVQSSRDTRLKKFLPLIYSDIGYILDSDKQFEKSFFYHQKAYESRVYSNDTAQWVMIYQNFFVIYINQGKVPLAKKYLDTASLFNKSFPISIKEVYIRNNYGIYYERIGDYSKAKHYYLEAYSLCDSLRNSYFKSTIANSLAKISVITGNSKAGGDFASEAIRLAIPLKNFPDAMAGFEILENIEKASHNYAKAYAYLDSFNIYADSLNTIETRKNIFSLETKYQSGLKEIEISRLRTSNAENELEVIKRNRFLWISGIALISFMLIGFLVYRNKGSLYEKEKKLQREKIAFLQQEQQVISMQSMINGQEAERTRIARDLHDGLGGLFSTVKMYFSTLEHQEKILQQNQLFKESYQLVDNAANEVRRIAHNMMPEVLLRMGLSKALKDLCNSINAGRKIEVVLQETGMDKRLDQSTEIMLFRIIQELLNNIMKHAESQKVLVELIRDENRLSVTVEDDGKGFDITEDDGKNHTGLESVKNRVHYLGGNIEIESGKGIGTSVMMHFPV